MQRWWLAPAGLLLIAAKGYEARPLGNLILPPAAAVGGEVTLNPGDVLLRQPIVAARSARLTEAVSLSIAGEQGQFPAGTMLEAVTLGGRAGQGLGGGVRVYCAPVVPMNTAAAASKAVIGAIGLGLFGGLQRTALGSRFCLVDGDGDDRVESAVLAGAKRAADLAPVSIAPVPVAVVDRVPLPAPSEIVLRYLGPVGLVGNIGFELTVTEGGRKLALAEYRTVVKPSQLPRTVAFQGAGFAVIAFEPAGKAARVRVTTPFPTGPYRFAAPPQTIYVYVPR